MKKVLLGVLTLTVLVSQANQQAESPMAQAVRNADLIEVKALLKSGQYSYSNLELSELMRYANGEINYCKKRIPFWNRIMKLANAGKPVATLLGIIGGGAAGGKVAFDYGVKRVGPSSLLVPFAGGPGAVGGAVVGGKAGAVTVGKIVAFAKRKKEYFEKRKKNLEIIADLLYEAK